MTHPSYEKREILFEAPDLSGDEFNFADGFLLLFGQTKRRKKKTCLFSIQSGARMSSVKCNSYCGNI